MTLQEKLNTINKPTITSYNPGNDVYIKDFYNNFIKPKLPNEDTIKKMHTELINYVRNKSFVSIIRIFNEHNEMKIRRGFFTKCNDNLSYFYTDNSFAYFFAKMAISNECPDNLGKDLLYMMQNFSFPYKYIIRGSLDNEKKYTAFPGWTKNPGLTNNYKLAHIFDVGGDKGCEYYYDGKKYSIGQICNLIFVRGSHSDWNFDPITQKYIRSLKIDDKYKVLAEKFLIAQFLRFIHPLNYFLAPKAPAPRTHIVYNHFEPYDHKKEYDIGEYKPLLHYVSMELKKLYPNEYKEFSELIMLPPDMYDYETEISLPINVEYNANGLSNYSSIQVSQKAPRVPKTSNSKNSLVSALPIDFYINNQPVSPDDFKDKLLQVKQCSRIWFYSNGTQKNEIWNATSFTKKSNLMGNIKTNSTYKKWKEKGITKVEFRI